MSFIEGPYLSLMITGMGQPGSSSELGSDRTIVEAITGNVGIAIGVHECKEH